MVKKRTKKFGQCPNSNVYFRLMSSLRKRDKKGESVSLVFMNLSEKVFHHKKIPAAERGLVEQAWQAVKRATTKKSKEDFILVLLLFFFLDKWQWRGGWWEELFQVGRRLKQVLTVDGLPLPCATY